jgi:hypothetical protein
MADLDPSYAHYALLIGIDAYPMKPLNGCVRDVHEIKKQLHGIPKPGVQTHMLTASRLEDSKSSRTTEELKMWPTYRNVVDTFNQIICQAKEGDFIYIHFSGHGTALRPPLNSSPSRTFSNPSTGDLALNLLQESGSNVHYLRGSELAYFVRAMVEKGLIVTLVLDCCFSGSVMRDDASIRYLDYDPQIDATYPASVEHSLDFEDELRHSVYRSASLSPNWLIKPDGYTVITACGPTEVAKEIPVDKQMHGALSYFLADTFETFGGIGGKQQHIYQSMRARFRETREKYQHKQNPMFYGNKDLYFFGRANPRIGPAPVPVIKNQRDTFHLEAGQAHGICEGDKFAVRAVTFTGSASREMVSQGISVVAEVTFVGALTSNLKLSETSFAGDTTLVATALTNLSLQRFPIRMGISVPYPEEWAKALSEQRSLHIYNTHVANQECRYSFTMAMLDDGSYEIRDETDRTILCLPASSFESSDNAVQVLGLFEHLAKFELVKSLTNNSFEDLTTRLKSSFSVQIIKPTGDRINPGCLQGGQYRPTCLHPECLIEVEDGTSIQLEVKNNEKEGGYAFCLHTYSMGSSWEIENILRGDYEVIPPCSSNQGPEFRRGSSGTRSKNLTMTVPLVLQEKGEKYCDDIIKVFLTSQPTSFLSLELPELGKYIKRSGFSKHRGTGSYSPSKDWVALSFRIRTYVKGA